MPTNRSLLARSPLLAAASMLPMFVLLTACPPNQPPAPANPYDLTARLVFPRTTQPITMDGQPIEAAWADGFDYELEQGALKPDGTLHGVSTDTDFYLAAKFDGDPLYDGFDAFVVLINPTGAGGNYHRFVVLPCNASGAGCPGAGGPNPTPEVRYQTGTLSGTSVNWAGPTPVPTGIEVKSYSIPGATNNSWSIEMKISRTALGGFNDNWMGLLANGIVADTNAETAVLYSWPQSAYVTGELDAAGGTADPPVAKWGQATLSTAFGNGVSVAYYEFGSNQADPSEIALNQPNSFHAWAINNRSTGGTLVPQADVKATFETANFGLSNNWNPVPPPSGNPTAAVTIPAAGAYRFESGLWTLSSSEIATYQNNTHQCVRVTLSSGNSSTVITQPTAQRNMTWVTVNSPLGGSATLDGKSFGKLMARERPYFRLREEFLNLDDGLDWQTRLAGAQQRDRSNWIAPMNADSSGKLGVWVNPSDKLQLPSMRVPLKPGTGGPNTHPMVAKVEPGSLVTLIVDGQLRLGQTAVTGGGISLEQARGARINLDRGELPKGSSNRFGAVLGSFDGFRTSFVVGNGVTLRVPAGASALSLKINDTDKGYAMQGGDGFSVQVIPGKVFPWMKTAFPQLARADREGAAMLPLGASLPSWIVHGYYPTNDYIIINKKRFKIERPAGSFGYSIRDVGVNRTPGTVGMIAATPIR